MFWPAARFFPISDLLREHFRAGIVETHAIDNRFVSNGAEHSRLRISGLRVPRHAAKLAKTKPEFFPDRNGGGKFIHAGGEANGIWKFQTENFNRQFRRAEKISD